MIDLTSPPSTAQPRWSWVLLAALLLWSLLLRLFFAGTGLDERRFWDERYSLENVRHILESGRVEAVNGWYPLPSYLPHTLVLAASQQVHEGTGWERAAILRGERFTPTAYFLCRALQATFGVVGLLLLFLIGRRLLDWRLGLLASLLLSVTPNHIRLSVFFKPDMILLCATLLCVLAGLRLLDRDRPRDFILAGSAVALAASANLSGVTTAVVVLVATVAGGMNRRRLLGLAAAGTTSAGLYFLLNPAWRLQLRYLERVRGHYDEHATASGHLAFFRGELEALASPAYHGPWLFAASLAGGLVLLESARRRSALRSLLVVASFPVAYSLVFAVLTDYAKANHILQVAPYTSLASSACLLLLWQARRAIPRRGAWRWLADPRLATAAAIVVLALPVLAAGAYVYRGVVPTTAQLLARRLVPRLTPLPLRFVVAESSTSAALVSWRDRAAVLAGSLDAVPPAELDLADAEIFPMTRLRADARYRRRSERPGVELIEVPSRPLRARGPGLVAVVHPWLPAGRPTTVRLQATGDEAGGRLPTLDRESVVSLRIWLPRLDPPPVLTVAGRTVPLYSTRTDGRQDRYLSPRLAGVGGAELRLLPAGGGLPPSGLQVEVHRWRRGGEGREEKSREGEL